MENMILKKIGTVVNQEGEMKIALDQTYLFALKGLDGFSHIQVLYWFDGCDTAASRSKLTERSPYKKGPAQIGTFATRTPERPNPIALSCAYITYVDEDNGIIGLAYIDAEDGSPVLDIKPYTPSLDRVEHPVVPKWCAHWPKSCEAGSDFDWEKEFNF